MYNCPLLDNFCLATMGEAIACGAILCCKDELLGGVVDQTSLAVLFLFFKTSLDLEKNTGKLNMSSALCLHGRLH